MFNSSAASNNNDDNSHMSPLVTIVKVVIIIIANGAVIGMVVYNSRKIKQLFKEEKSLREVRT